MNWLKSWLVSLPIRNKVLIFGLIMSTFPLLLLSYYYYFHMKEDYKVRILETQKLTIENLAYEIEMEMNQTFHQFQVFTALNDLDREKGAFYGLFQENDSIDEVVTTDGKGKVEKRVSRYSLNIIEENEQWYTDQMWSDFQKNDKVYGEVEFNTFGQPIMKIAIPYMEDGMKKGIGVTIQLQEIISQISSKYNKDDSSLYLVDQSNRIIAHQDYSNLWKKQDPIATNDVLNVETDLKNPQWTLVMEQPETSAYEPINKMLLNGIIAVLLVTIFVALISVYAGFYFTNPIILIQKAMSNLKSDKMAERLNIKRTDELGQLADTFNEMSTEIRRQSIRLEQEKERLDIVLNGFEAGLALVTKDYRITWANPILQNWLSKDYYTLPCYKAIGPDKGPCEECPISDPNLSQMSDITLTKKLKDGTERVFRHRVFPLNEAIEGEGEYLVVLEDITEKKKFDDQMVQTDKLSALGLMASSFAHEVNNPLTTIHVYAEDLIERMELGDEDLDQEEISLYLSKIKDNTARCKRITSNLLNFSHQSKWNLASLNLHVVIQNSIDLLEHQVKKKRIVLQTDLQEVLPNIQGDGIQLMQVLVNLLNNSIDAVEVGGKIKVAIKSHQGQIVIEVSDDGTGIPKDILPKVMDPFFTTKPVGKGTGLGLSICYGIVQQFGGKMIIDSLERNGTVVTIHLPIK